MTLSSNLYMLRMFFSCSFFAFSATCYTIQILSTISCRHRLFSIFIIIIDNSSPKNWSINFRRLYCCDNAKTLKKFWKSYNCPSKKTYVYIFLFERGNIRCISNCFYPYNTWSQGNKMHSLLIMRQVLIPKGKLLCTTWVIYY